LRMNICKRSEELVNVQLYLQYWHGRFHLVEISRGAVHGLWHELKYKVEVHLIFLEGK